jgi:thiamine-monophosphate kinase
MPRVAFARAVRDIRRLALNDISDGIGSELHEIAEESNVSLLVEDAAIPVHPGLQLFPKELQDKWKLFGGEDFELVGTVSQADWPDIQHIADKVNVKVTLIGSAGIPDEHPVYLRKNGKIKVLPKEGYTHLK